jgi:hypothetical protein
MQQKTNESFNKLTLRSILILDIFIFYSPENYNRICQR